MNSEVGHRPDVDGWERGGAMRRRPACLGGGSSRVTCLLVIALTILSSGCKSAPKLTFSLSSEDGDGPQDAARIVARLDAMDIDAVAENIEARAFELRVSKVAELGTILSTVLARNALTLRAVAQEQDLLAPGEKVRDTEAVIRQSGPLHKLGVDVWAWNNRAELDAFVSASKLPAGRLVAVEQVTGLGHDGSVIWERWQPVVLMDPPIIDGSQIASAQIAFDQRNEPVVEIHMDESGRRRFADGTAALVDKYLAVCVDDAIVSMPMVAEPITGGQAQVWVGAAEPLAQRKALGSALAASFATGALKGSWSRVR